jgi:hypothetical protein
MTGKGERPAACVEFRVRLLELGLALHLFRISVDAVEARQLREGGAGRIEAWFGFAHLLPHCAPRGPRVGRAFLRLPGCAQ